MHLENIGGGFTRSDIESVMIDVADQWMNAVDGLRIQLVDKKKNDHHFSVGFEIKDTKVDNIGSYTFDGPLGDLAHAFPPQAFREKWFSSRKKEGAGDIHFDAEETWSLTPGPQGTTISLHDILLHEMGHALGLDHDDLLRTDGYSVMHSTELTGVSNLKSDDIAGIQSIFDALQDCPFGFTYDGAACWSKKYWDPNIHTPFIWQNAFYVSAGPNNSCPFGFTYNGSACYSGRHFDENEWEHFYWNNCLYLKPKCE